MSNFCEVSCWQMLVLQLLRKVEENFLRLRSINGKEKIIKLIRQ